MNPLTYNKTTIINNNNSDNAVFKHAERVRPID